MDCESINAQSHFGVQWVRVQWVPVFTVSFALRSDDTSCLV